MEKPDIEIKYHKLATEFSKVRSQATVLKKAVLEEQAKNSQLNEYIKIHEQTIRKHDQEMESLIFRNEQLTKRISVLQQELQINNHSKKTKSKGVENAVNSDVSVLDEELQKKIIENAQLVNSVTDKEIEIGEYKEKIQWLEEKMCVLEKTLDDVEKSHKLEVDKIKRDRLKAEKTAFEVPASGSLNNSKNCDNEAEVKRLRDEVARYKVELELFKSKPSSNDQLTNYYDRQLKEITEQKIFAESETKSLWAENACLEARLEDITLKFNEMETSLAKSYEELVTTHDNYKTQLDAMTEHLASQNERITKQCDEIQLLKHMLSIKK